jgi:hypothetical protein
MKLRRRVTHTADHIVAAARDFFVRKILGITWPTIAFNIPVVGAAFANRISYVISPEGKILYAYSQAERVSLPSPRNARGA